MTTATVPTVTRIVCNLSFDGLFGGSDTTDVDTEATGDAFAEAFAERIQESYPSADVTVLYSHSNNANDVIEVDTAADVDDSPIKAEVQADLQDLFEQMWRDAEWIVMDKAEPRYLYTVREYGGAGDGRLANPLVETGYQSLDDARAAVAKLIGQPLDVIRLGANGWCWDGQPADDEEYDPDIIEAYHASENEECGGYQIERVLDNDA